MSDILYKVQVGSFGKLENAKNKLKEIKDAGFNGIIVEHGELYRVQCGAFKSRSNAEKLLDKVKRFFGNAVIIAERDKIYATPVNNTDFNIPYKVMLTTKATNVNQIPNGVLVIEPEDYTLAEINNLKKSGLKLLGYISIGSVSDERPYYKELKPFRLSRLEDWQHELYLDLTKEKVREWCLKRSKEIKAMGFDGWWIDNVDVYEYHKSDAMYKGITTTLKAIKDVGGYVMVNGGSEYMSRLMDSDKNHDSISFIDGVTQEEVISLITSYSGKGKFGKQKSDMSKWYKSYMCRLLRHKIQAFLLEYTKDKSVKDAIMEFCSEKGMTGYYISEDVDL